MKKSKAFTVIELVIVIAVVAVLASVLIPAFTSIIEKAKESAKMQEQAIKDKESITDSILSNPPEQDDDPPENPDIIGGEAPPLNISKHENYDPDGIEVSYEHEDFINYEEKQDETKKFAIKIDSLGIDWTGTYVGTKQVRTDRRIVDCYENGDRYAYVDTVKQKIISCYFPYNVSLTTEQDYKNAIKAILDDSIDFSRYNYSCSTSFKDNSIVEEFRSGSDSQRYSFDLTYVVNDTIIEKLQVDFFPESKHVRFNAVLFDRGYDASKVQSYTMLADELKETVKYYSYELRGGNEGSDNWITDIYVSQAVYFENNGTPYLCFEIGVKLRIGYVSMVANCDLTSRIK